MITGGIYTFALADAARAQDSQPPQLNRSLHCRSQQPTDLTRRYRFWPFPLLDTPVAVAGGRFDTPNRITERPFCEELHGHFWRRPFGLSDSKDSALQ